MSKKNILLAITNGIWLIQPEFAYNAGGIVSNILSGKSAFSATDNEDSGVKAFIVGASNEIVFGDKYNPFRDASPGSTAVIGISGPIMKYDNCGDPGTQTYGQLLKKAEQNPNISSIILKIDSPGGTVDGTQELAQLVKSLTKPVVAFVDGLMASAAYWIGSSANTIVANNETSLIGSIGTMMSFADAQPMYEKMGVKFHEIYASKSVDKNKDFAEARKGNYELVKQKLDSINEVFLSAVKNNREGKLDLKTENVLTGKTYLAEDALKAGLIDSIGDFDSAILLARELSSGSKESTSKINNQNMKKITLMASHAALLALCGASIEAGKESVDVELNDELINKINSALVAGETAANEAKEVKASLEKSTADLATANASIKTLEGSVETLTAENKKLGAQTAGITSTTKTSPDKIEEAAEDKYKTSVDIEKQKFND